MAEGLKGFSVRLLTYSSASLAVGRVRRGRRHYSAFGRVCYGSWIPQNMDIAMEVCYGYPTLWYGEIVMEGFVMGFWKRYPKICLF